MLNIYEMAVKTMPKEDIAHWCSDLYLRVTDQSRALVDSYDYRKNVKTFVDNIDRVLWYEIPFAYCGEGWRG